MQTTTTTTTTASTSKISEELSTVIANALFVAFFRLRTLLLCLANSTWILRPRARVASSRFPRRLIVLMRVTRMTLPVRRVAYIEIVNCYFQFVSRSRNYNERNKRPIILKLQRRSAFYREKVGDKEKVTDTSGIFIALCTSSR